MNELKSARRFPKRRWMALALLVALFAWVAFDLYAPRRTSLRDFNPDEVARLETAMWRSYYGRERLKLFLQLAELLRTQYRLRFWRSNVTAFRAARAAFVFKDGHSRADYEKALPDLVKFYEAVRSVSDTPFDTERAARLELEWWIIHRERKRHAPADLERALAELPSELYRVPIEPLAEHARLRAQAMLIRDDRAETTNGVTQQDWQHIDELLHASWRSLHKVVN
ncbi:MAG TPA: hypothetical protein VF666_03210 [Pyrinomonadaceae bacterium]|jgi:hypothetical protein